MRRWPHRFVTSRARAGPAGTAGHLSGHSLPEYSAGTGATRYKNVTITFEYGSVNAICACPARSARHDARRVACGAWRANQGGRVARRNIAARAAAQSSTR